MAERNIPLRVFHFDCYWINPYIAQGTDFFREGLEHGYFVMRKDGKGPRQLDFWQPGMALVDFTNPAATKWYTKVYDFFHFRYLYVKIQYLPWAKMISCLIMNMQMPGGAIQTELEVNYTDKGVI